MDNSSLKYTALSIILFFSISIFLQLGKSEIQPWDEGLYAYRAKAVIEHDAIWDQTKYSIGELYSSTYPPLTVWAIATAMKFFLPATALRVFSALCDSLSLLLIFVIARRLLNEDLSLLIIIGLAVTLTWNKYSRQGMTDVPVVTFSLIAFWMVIRIIEAEKFKQAIIYGLFFALSFAAALMSKILVSLLPLLFASMLISGKYDSRKKITVAISVAVAFLLAMPWHIYMIQTYGAEFYGAFFAPHIYTAVEANTQSLGAGYYINQLIIANPFFLLAIFLFFAAVTKFKKIYSMISGSSGKFVFLVSFIWFYGLLFLFSFSTTKLPHYPVYMIVPGLILAAFMFEHYKEILQLERTQWFMFTLLVASVFWSISYGLRQEIKQVLMLSRFSFGSFLFISAIAMLLVAGIYIKKEKLAAIIPKILPQASYAFVLILVIRLVSVNIFGDDNISGAREIAKVLNNEKQDTLVYLYHEYNGSDSLNPQIAWYTDGWNIGQRKGKYCVNVSMPKQKISYKSIIETDRIKNSLLLYYVSNNSELAGFVIYEIAKRRRILKAKKNYIIFDKYTKPKKTGKEI